ncbi:MAG: M24 family metallopeptidase [Rhizomicrobium sp.]
MNILLLPEKDRRAQLEAAETKAFSLLDAIERAGLIAPGKTEAELDAEIYELAKRDFGVEKHWHRRVVRAGPNTLCTFYDKPPVCAIGPDDIVYLDLGPVFAEWEADVGRSYAVGGDPDKRRLVADLPRTFDIAKAHYERSPDITGAELYRFAQTAAQDAGWEFGGVIAGHIVGEFPHAQRVPGDKDQHRIGPFNRKRMRDPDAHGHTRHWILEIHLVDRAREFGGFYERLL